MSGEAGFVSVKIILVFLAVFIILPNPIIVNNDSVNNDASKSIDLDMKNDPVSRYDEGLFDESPSSAKTRAPLPAEERWLQMSRPSARSEHAMVFDSTGNKLYMYGGWDLSNELSDLWMFDTTAGKWEDINDGKNPGGRHYHSMVYEYTNSRIYLFGGYDGDANTNDLWMYNLSRTAWELVDDGTGGSAPNPRSGHGMVYDSGQHAIMIFGGADYASYFNDVWKFDLASKQWSEVTVTATKPSGRTELDMVYDSTNNNIYMFGGFDGNNYLEDLWKFEVGINAWSEITPAGLSRPPERSDHTMVYHSSGNRVYMFGGLYLSISVIKEYRADFWYYDIGTNQWHQPEDGPSPSPRARHAMAVDQDDGEIYILEGYSGVFREDLWKYKTAQNRWEVIYDSAPVQSPSIRNGQGLVFDPNDNCLYYFGGYYFDGQPHYREDMWKFDLTTKLWTLVNEGTGPEARFARGVVYDSSAHEIYMFGGYYYDFFGGTRNYLNDLWLYNITTFSWQEINDGSTVPQPRDGHRMIYDTASGDIFLHGGRKWISAGNYNYYGDLWRYDVSGQSWTNLTDSTTVSGRSRQSMCFDSRHGDIYVFGGFNASGYNNETWKYNIATNNWTLLSPTGVVPSPRGAHDMVYDSANDNIYLFSGKNQDTPNPVVLNDFYMFNVSTQNWSQVSLPVSQAPTPRIQYGIAYDRFENIFYLSGGYYYDTADRFYANLSHYEPSSGNWTEIKVKRPYPEPCIDGTMQTNVGHSEIYQFGGWDGAEYLDRLWILDKTTNQYMVYDPDTEERPAGRRGHGMALDGSTFYIFGGTNGTYLNDLWWFQQGIVKWVRIIPGGTAPPGRERFQMVYGGSQEIYLFSGWAGTTLDDFWKYDISANTWTELTPSGTKPSARQRYAMVADTNGGYLYLFGGFDSTLKYKNDLWRYDIAGNAWTELATFTGQAPTPRDGMGMWFEPESNSLFVFGGKDSGGLYSDFHKFDIDNNLWIKVSTENAEPSPRNSFAYTYDEATKTIFCYGGWSNYYKGDLWTWKVASSPGIRQLNVQFNDGDNPGNYTVYSMYRDYEFTINIKDATSYKNIERINLTFDSGNGIVPFQWIEETDEFIKLGDPSDIIILSDDSFSTHDSSQTYTLYFKLKFNWTYTDEGLQGLEIIAESDNQGADYTMNHNSLFAVENDLDFHGNLEVSGNVQGALSDGDWVKKDEMLTWQNLTVVYQGTTDIYPPDDQFDVAVWDDDGHVWTDSESSGEDIFIQTTASNITDLTEDYVINITLIPAENDNTTKVFDLKVDADSVQFSNALPEPTVLNNELNVQCSIEITDGDPTTSSGVDADTIEYSYSTNGGGTWSPWTNAGETGIADEIIPSVGVEFADTFNNFISWRATDAVGNDLGNSDNYKVPVDTSYSPSAPTTLLTSPFDRSAVSTLTPLLVWSGEDPEGDEINYDIYIGLDKEKVRDRDGSLKVVSGLETSFYFLTSELRDGLMHYWTVIPHDESYTGRCVSDVWEFTPHKTLGGVPNATLVMPEDEDIQDILTPTLEWELNNTGPSVVNNLVLVYKAGVQIGGSGTAIEEVMLAEFQASQLGNKFTVPAGTLLDNTNYEWLVVPHSGGKRGICENGPFGFYTNTSYKEIYQLEIQAPEDLPVTPGRNSSTSVTIKNTGNVEDTIDITLDGGTIEDYITFEYTGGGLILGPGSEQKLNIAINLPESFSPGEYPIKITATSQGSSGTVTVDSTIKIIIEDDSADIEPDDEEKSNALLYAGIGIVAVVIVILVLLFLVILPKRKKVEEPAVPTELVTAQPGEVSAEVSYIPKGAFESERAAFSAFTGQQQGAEAPYPELPGVAGTEGAAGGVVTPTEPLPPQPPEEPEVGAEQLPETPVSPYEGAPTETPVEPPSPEGWAQAPQLPPVEGEQPSPEEPVRYDTVEGEAPQPPAEPDPEPEPYEEPQQQQYYEQQQQQAPAYTPCAYCGAQVAYGNQYCTTCGSQLY
jgi:hypothetical protein